MDAYRKYLQAQSFNPERIEILNEAFQGACNDIGVTEMTPCMRDIIAKRTVEPADGHGRQRSVLQCSRPSSSVARRVIHSPAWP